MTVDSADGVRISSIRHQVVTQLGRTGELDLVAVPAPARHVQQLIEQTVVASDRSGSHWALSRATDENEMVLAPTAA